MKKEVLLIKLIGISIIIAIVVAGGFYMYNSGGHIVEEDNITVLQPSDKVKLKVKKVDCDENGNVSVQVLTKNDDISYEYHNWTLGDGEGPYKKVQIALVQADGMVIGKTYPYGVQLTEEDLAEGYTEADGCQCYIRTNNNYDDEFEIAVIYEDRDGERYVIYQE